jgi:hypothetical protein
MVLFRKVKHWIDNPSCKPPICGVKKIIDLLTYIKKKPMEPITLERGLPICILRPNHIRPKWCSSYKHTNINLKIKICVNFVMFVTIDMAIFIRFEIKTNYKLTYIHNSVVYYTSFNHNILWLNEANFTHFQVDYNVCIMMELFQQNKFILTSRKWFKMSDFEDSLIDLANILQNWFFSISESISSLDITYKF